MADHEVVVIGGGLAGSTAGLFAARLGRSTLVFNSGLPGGQLLNVGMIEDYPGFPDGIAGFDLCPSVQDQALAAGADFEMAEVEKLEPSDGMWTIHTTAGEVGARAVIIASGSRPKALGVPGEDRLEGRGVSHCASCDGPLYRQRVVGVVGGGDSALQESLELVSHVGSVILFHRGDSLSAHETYQRRVLGSDQISIRFNTVVEEILGEHSVEAVKVREEGDRVSTVEVAGLFVYIGGAPHTQFLGDQLALDHHGRVLTDAWMRTVLRGLLAAGDVRSDSAAQAVTVAGDGATAAIAAHRYLDEGVWRSVQTFASGT